MKISDHVFGLEPQDKLPDIICGSDFPKVVDIQTACLYNSVVGKNTATLKWLTGKEKPLRLATAVLDDKVLRWYHIQLKKIKQLLGGNSFKRDLLLVDAIRKNLPDEKI